MPDFHIELAQFLPNFAIIFFFLRQYDRLTKQIKPDMEAYERQREKLGDSFYANSSTIVQGLHKDTPEAIDRMVQDLEKQ